MPRMTLDMDSKFDEVLTRLAEGGSKADVIRKAVQTYSYLKSQVPSYTSEKRVSISKEDGTILNSIILP